MSWQLVGTIASSSEWQLTEPVLGSLFRIAHSTDSDHPTDLRAIIAQAFVEGDTTTYFDTKRLTYKPETEAFYFNQPKELIDRRIAIKRLDSLLDDWNIGIEVLQLENSLTIEDSIRNIQTNLEEIKMALTNPITINIPSTQQTLSNVISTIIPVPPNIITGIVLVGANEGRRGLTLFNNSVGSVLIDFGKIPTHSDYAVLIAPQGYYELPYLYVGEIQGIWTDLGGVGIVIREFVNYNPEPQA